MLLLVRAAPAHPVLHNLHLVGHSLGAHVAGFMAKKVASLGLGKVPRLTGLDPAYPCYELLGPEGRVDKTDAELVQIVHTNSGWLWEGCLSFKVNTRSALFCMEPYLLQEPLGHVDFYPAGGSHQPGCTDLINVDSPLIDLLKVRLGTHLAPDTGAAGRLQPRQVQQLLRGERAHCARGR